MESAVDELKRIPPHQIEAEQSLLGGILIDNEGLPSALEVLRGDEFYRDTHRTIFRAIQALFERNEPIDLTTVAGRNQRHAEVAPGVDAASSGAACPDCCVGARDRLDCPAAAGVADV